MSFIEREDGIYARLEGIIDDTAEVGLNLFSWSVPYDRIVIGGNYQAVGRNAGDKITYQVVHPEMGVLNEFISDWNVGEREEFSLYRSRIYKGLEIHIYYENVGPNPVRLLVNMNMHEEK